MSVLFAVARIRLRPMPRDKLQGEEAAAAAEEAGEEGGVWPIRILEHARSDQVDTMYCHISPCLGRTVEIPIMGLRSHEAQREGCVTPYFIFLW